MSTFLSHIQHVPYLGFGLGLKDEYFQEIATHAQNSELTEQIDWLELIPENYMGKGGASLNVLESLLEAGFPMASHGVNLSLGSVDDFNEAYMEALEALFETVQPAWFSDHLSFSSVEGKYFNDLMPLPFSKETVAHCVNKIRQIKARFPYPFLIENISYYTHFKQPDALEEAAFLTEILEQADCGLLLDVNNVFVNSQNHGYDPIAFLQALPLQRVVEIHMAGHLQTETLIIDTHGEALCQEVLALFTWVYPRCPNLKGVLLERDTNLPAFDELMSELQAIRLAAYSSKPLLSSVTSGY
jgi:uncharacterized protein